MQTKEFQPGKKARRVIVTYSIEPGTRDMVESLARQYRVSRSEVVETALSQYLSKVLKAPTPSEDISDAQ